MQVKSLDAGIQQIIQKMPLNESTDTPTAVAARLAESLQKEGIKAVVRVQGSDVVAKRVLIEN